MKYKPSYGIAGSSRALKENGDLLSVVSANGDCKNERERTRIRRETDRAKGRESEKSHWQRNSLSKDLDARLDDEIERAQGKEMPSPSAKEC